MSRQGSVDHVGWERALDDMEAFLFSAASEVHHVIEDDKPWTAPELGPLPLDLADRARALLIHQQRVIEELRVAQEALRHQRAVTQRFTGAACRADGPVYVDHSL